MHALYQTLAARKRPEDVAEMIREERGSQLSRAELAVLETAARGALKRHLIGYTSMLEEFATPIGLERQVMTAARLFPAAQAMTAAECSDPAVVEVFITTISLTIRKTVGLSDFKADRLNRSARAESNLDLSHRRYNKLFRHICRMEEKLQTLVRELRKLTFQKIGKSGLASFLTWEEFARDADSACFVAYYTARANLRSEFTIAGQQKPYDEIADMLLTRCMRQATTNWWAIAHVYPHQEVVAHLTDAQKGTLLGRWYGILGDVGELLDETWQRSNIVKETMIVRLGNDSSTWNNTANAWNTARNHWINLIYALGMDEILDAVCPGKVLRLMAADVVAWHRMAGGGLDPDTAVWDALPLPWLVMRGDAVCNRQMIETICQQKGVDAAQKGWIAPPPVTRVAAFRPSPELVHGVTVANPILAKVLRQAGYFSGKPKYSSPAQ